MKLLENVKKGKLFRPLDTVAAVLLIVAIVLCVVGFSSPQGESLNVYLDGKLYATYSLEENREVVIDRDGVAMTVIVDDGTVFVHSSNCKNHICESGSISKSGQSLVCMPNKVVLKISGEAEVDGVTR